MIDFFPLSLASNSSIWRQFKYKNEQSGNDFPFSRAPRNKWKRPTGCSLARSPDDFNINQSIAATSLGLESYCSNLAGQLASESGEEARLGRRLALMGGA